MEYKKIAELRPTISSENMGDYIIQDYIDKIFDSLFGNRMTVTLPTRSHLTSHNYEHLASADFRFVCGTNLISSTMNKVKQWDLTLTDIFKMKEIILLGVGWWQYQEESNLYSKVLLNKILTKNYLHSVRDSYTERMLRQIGINNVINTACPTMWGLTADFCKKIPKVKSDEVITTLTNYHKDENLDLWIINTLLKHYKTVYIWLQAIEDLDELRRVGIEDSVEVIAPSLNAYDKVLSKKVDYIGTRLHGGIRALNFQSRTLILAVDNRAIEIAKDTNIPVIPRQEVKKRLEEWICSEISTEITIPVDSIKIWKEQFY